MHVIVEDNKVVTINVDIAEFPTAAEAPDDIVFGDRYENGEWIRCGERRSEPEPLSPSDTEVLRADVDYIAIMMGVDLYV